MGLLTNRLTATSASGAIAISRLVVGLSLGLGFAIAAHLSIPAPATASSLDSANLNASSDQSGLSDGVYLYGESNQPNQIGKAYFVFEVKQHRVAGAFYMPSSSFDCAYGQFQAEQLALTVVGSYDKTTSPYEIGLDHTAVVATNGNVAEPEIGLQGFHRLDQVSDNDRRILSVCKAAQVAQ